MTAVARTSQVDVLAITICIMDLYGVAIVTRRLCHSRGNINEMFAIYLAFKETLKSFSH